MNDAITRKVAARILAALPVRTSCRLVFCTVAVRNCGAAMLELVKLHVRREVAAQAAFVARGGR